DDTLSPALDKVGGKMKDLEKTANQTQGAIGKVGGATLQLAGALGQTEGLTGALAQGLLNVATAGNAAGAVMATFDTILKVVAARMNEAREALRQLQEQQLAQIEAETKALQFENQIKRQIAVLRAAVPEIEAVRQKYAQLRLEQTKLAEQRPQIGAE